MYFDPLEALGNTKNDLPNVGRITFRPHEDQGVYIGDPSDLHMAWGSTGYPQELGLPPMGEIVYNRQPLDPCSVIYRYIYIYIYIYIY